MLLMHQFDEALPSFAFLPSFSLDLGSAWQHIAICGLLAMAADSQTMCALFRFLLSQVANQSIPSLPLSYNPR
jgi:hypothetical protein